MSKQYPPRPKAGASFYKAHGLGNDYLVFEEGDAWTLTPAAVEAVCERFRGPGGDGIVLLLGSESERGATGPFRLRMFNPDGSEFERSGNGLRVLASYLARRRWVGNDTFAVEVGGDRVEMTVHSVRGTVYDVSAEMGKALVGPGAVELDPTALDGDGLLPGPGGELLDLTPVAVGNPHMVVWRDAPDDVELRQIGPFVTAHPALAHGANVQLAKVVGPRACRAFIWERGVGRTSASGTSSCAVATAAVVRGDVEPGTITVHMDGGDLQVDVSANLDVILRGPVEEVFEGALTDAFVATLPG